MRFSKAVVKYRVAILIVALALLAPAVLGMVNTRINYDMLDYLPEDMDTVIGQNELLSDFGKGAFSMLVMGVAMIGVSLLGTKADGNGPQIQQKRGFCCFRGLDRGLW